jgi:phosphoribosyl-ATP pyrophosphohydrolase/phosphoribosyl-AMP cyclohydrolase
MRVVALHADCDGDAVVALVMPAGPACHTGTTSCFTARPSLAALADTIASREAQPGTASYTRKLLDNPNLRAKKLGEEAVELAMACATGTKESVAEEGADLLYHLVVACHAEGVTLEDITAVLDRRSVRASSSQKNAVDSEKHDGTEDCKTE